MKNLREYGFKTDNRTYIVAEIGINHGGNLKTAFELIDSAARAGVDAVKFQTYLTELRAPAGNRAIFDILKKCELSFESFREIKNYANEKRVEFFSTPFDRESVEYLESIDCPIYKIASFDIVNTKLLNEIGKKKKPVLLSVGMSNLNEISNAYKILRANTSRIGLLHCISAYPTPEREANLAAIHTLKQKFDCVIGHSDHTNDILVPLYAAAAGAQIIEKHFRISEKMECIDAPVSITEIQMNKLIEETRRLEDIMGDGTVQSTDIQKSIVPFRRHT